MKGLRKYLTPFAPDQSGAVSVLYELGGMLIIIDAGGCVGNICGFDEPRWRDSRSAIFSAGLRDMDAIMGRDEQMIHKISLAAEQISAGFIALISTPVPAVIGTDYHALTRLAERRLGIPVLGIDTNGMDLYDKGASKAYLELLARFAGTDRTDQAEAGGTHATRPDTVCMLGCCPLDMPFRVKTAGCDDSAGVPVADWLRGHYSGLGFSDVMIMGAGGLGEVRRADSASLNIVASPSGLAAARYMKKKFGIPYRCEDAVSAEFARGVAESRGRLGRVLVIDQQIAGCSMREELLPSAESVTVASWFMMDSELRQPDDTRLTEEDQFEKLAREGGYDLIIADPVLKDLAGGVAEFIEKPQFALSGKESI